MYRRILMCVTWLAAFFGASDLVMASSVNVTAELRVEQPCLAKPRIRDANSRGVALQAGETYAVVQLNKAPPLTTHYRILMPKAPDPQLRWVAADCGTLLGLQVTSSKGSSRPTRAIEPDSIENTLAISWQPGFCATKGRFDRAGKLRLGCQFPAGDPALSQFSLHGLWPDDLDDKAIFPCNCHLGDRPTSCQPEYNDRRPNRPRVDLKPSERIELEISMPGARGKGNTLAEHEWYKHGTCFEQFDSIDQGADAQEYFSDSLHLLDQINASAFATFFYGLSQQDKPVTAQDILSVFADVFGEQAAKRVLITCRPALNPNDSLNDGPSNSPSNIPVIVDLYLGLKGKIDETANLRSLMEAAPPLDAATNTKQCDQAYVVRGLPHTGE